MNSYILSKEESDRIYILKYIAIIFVVYIHAYSVEVDFAEGTNILFLPQWLLLFEKLISKLIAACGVPLFFLISSILLFKKKRTYKATIFNRMRTLLLPYLFWNSFWIFVFILLQNLSFTAPYFSGNHTPILQCSFAEWLKLYGIGLDFPTPHDYPLWFMRDLILITLCFPIISKVANKFPKTLLVLTVVLLLVPISFPLKGALLWFCLGACIVKLQIHMTLLDGISFWKISLIYILLAIGALVTDSAIINGIFVFGGLIYWIRASKVIFDCKKARELFLRLSKWTFVIFVAHELTLSSLRKICLRLLPAEPIWLLIEYIFLPILVIIGCSIAGVVFKRIFPKIYGIATGAR